MFSFFSNLGRESDTHAQIGPGQEFIVKTTCGHKWTTNTIVVLAGEDEYRLADSSLSDWVAEYIEDAPEGSNVASDAAYRRKRDATGSTSTEYEDAEGEFFQGAIDPSDEFFYSHPITETEVMYEYSDDVVADDRRISYEHENLTWIQEVNIYIYIYIFFF